jgi:hypothetical protein
MKPREEYPQDKTCLFVVTPKGQLGILHTPFRAQVRRKNSKHKRNAWVFIREVKTEFGNRLLFRVDDEWWWYGGFKLFIAQ